MRPRDHVILGSIASIGLYIYLGPGSILNVIYFWLASILIDIDHYIDYIYNNKFTDYSFKRMMKYHGLLFSRRFDPAFLNLSIFHTVEFMAPLGILALYTEWRGLVFVWWAFLFHIMCDTFKLIKDGKPSIRCNTVIEYYFRVKKLKAQGLDTKAIYTNAANEIRGTYGN
jgi:hypothetical protein